ncbi:MAG: AI-2E family transporter [Firmicutes bacterium]|nr:AI-2E family transporter [Clostridiales bacterium]MDD6297920.1 AI-2E family transporter [Bacillota bacterium]
MEISKKTLQRIFIGVASCILLYWLLHETERVKNVFTTLETLFAPFIIGAALAFILNVPMRSIERLLKKIPNPGARRILSIVLTLVALLLVLAFVFYMLIPQVGSTVEALVAQLPVFFKQVQDRFNEYLLEHPDIMEWVTANTDLEKLDWNTILQKAGAILGNSLTAIANGAVSAIGSVTGAIVNLVIAIVFSFYCLSRKEILARQGRRVIYSILPEKFCDKLIRILRLTNSTFSSFISGQCVEACILGSMFAVTMAIFRMPYVPLVSVLIAVTALVPVVGAFVGCVLGAFFILVDNPLQAVWFVVIFQVLQQIENNMIYPRVVGTSIGLPGMWVLMAVTIGGNLMGVGGMLLMIPLASVAYTLAREFTDRRLKERNIPDEKVQDQPPELQSKFKEKRKASKQKRAHKKLLRFQEKQNK